MFALPTFGPCFIVEYPLESVKMSFRVSSPCIVGIFGIWNLHGILSVWCCEVLRSVEIGQSLKLRTAVTDTAPCSQIIYRVVASLQGCEESRSVLAEDH